MMKSVRLTLADNMDKHPLHTLCAGGVFYVSVQSALGIGTAGIWLGDFTRGVDGRWVSLLLLWFRIRCGRVFGV